MSKAQVVAEKETQGREQNPEENSTTDWGVRQGDCRDLLEEMAEAGEEIDLCFTSPPYFDAINYKGHIEKTNGEQDWWERKDGDYQEYLQFLEESFSQLLDVTKNGGFCIVNISPIMSDGNRYPLMSDLLTVMQRVGWEWREDILWHKNFSRDRRSGVLMQNPYPGYYYPSIVTEYIMVFQNGDDKIYEGRSQREKEKNEINMDNFQEDFATNMWTIEPVPPQEIEHPAPFPQELAERVVNLYSYEDDTVVDIFSGSGQTGLAAVNNNREYIGLETMEKYVELSKKRIQNSIED